METVGRKAEAPGQRQKSEKPDQTTRQPYTTCQTCRAQKDSYRAIMLSSHADTATTTEDGTNPTTTETTTATTISHKAS